LLVPTATDDQLGADRWAAGPTAVALKQNGKLTYGMLANHLESFAGSGSGDVSATFLQPFMAYVTDTQTTYSINTESTYDWEARQWSAPINIAVAQLLRAGDQLLQVSIGARYWVDAPEAGPDGWGLRAGVTLLFPR
jgi:hypothetical protein